MEERQVQDLTRMQEIVQSFYQLDDDSFEKMQICLNQLLFRRGLLDGTFEMDADMYHFVLLHRDLINEYLSIVGLCVLFDTEQMQLWVDLIPKMDGRVCTPFTVSSMNGNQVILLAVLQKRLAERDSSTDIGLENLQGVYVTERDILKDMYPYMNNTQDEKRRRDDALAAVNRFVRDLGILRLIHSNLLLKDGSRSNLYRISQFIENQFDVDKLSEILEVVIAKTKEGSDESVQ